jgi:hypothetical protein
MSTVPRLILALAVGLALAFSPAAASAPDFTGTWLGTTEVPDVGTDQIALVIRKAQAGLAATISDSAQMIAPNTEARDVKVEGEAIAFWFPLASGESVSVQLKIAGDTLTGGWTHESGSTGSMQFARKK